MDSVELKLRTKSFGLKVIQLVEALPKTKTGNVIGNQLLRSATSVGANYRAACRAKSRPDFIAKAGIVIEEADESLYWLELLVESGLVDKSKLVELMDEGDQIVAILVGSVKTARSNLQKAKSV